MDINALDDEHPWPGLAPYGEVSRKYFKGRENESALLADLVEANPVVSLYGKSGLGKSSLLQAGVFPKLRARGFLPVYARINFASSESPWSQLLGLLVNAAGVERLDYPEASPGEELWQYLHRPNFEIWTLDNYLRTPVFVIDQFEEVFSRGRQQLVSVMETLGDLVENRIPSTVASDDSILAALDVVHMRYRVVISFREDYLPDVRAWEPRLPSLLRNFMRLLPMTYSVAERAIRSAGQAVLAEGVAEAIVDFVAEGRKDADLEPVMLSLFCTQLNQRREQNRVIDAELLRSSGENIVENFYEDALISFPEHVQCFIEEHLIQGRLRGSYARDEAISQGFINERQLDQLTSLHRVLRVEQQGNVARIELIHDRLVEVVRRARDKRSAENDFKLAQREASSRWRQKLFVVSVFAAIVLAGVAYYVNIKKDEADRERVLAKAAGDRAVLEKEKAEARFKQLGVLANYGWAGSIDQHLFDNAVSANDSIQRLFGVPADQDIARRNAVMLQIWRKDVDKARVELSLSSLRSVGFRVEFKQAKLREDKTNTVLFGSKVQLDDVKLVVLSLMRAGIPVLSIVPIQSWIPSHDQAVIQVGSSRCRNERVPYTAEAVERAASFSHRSVDC